MSRKEMKLKIVNLDCMQRQKELAMHQINSVLISKKYRTESLLQQQLLLKSLLTTQISIRELSIKFKEEQK